MTSAHSESEPSTSFDRLAPEMQRWIWDQGWEDLRDIQEAAIHHLTSSQRDLIIAAPTARGKTEAALLPLLSRAVKNPSQGGFDIVYIAPLKALINDQFRRAEDLCERAGLPLTPWHGDIAQSTKNRARQIPRGVLMITPESLEAMFVLRGTQIPRMFQSTQAIIIDELHALLDTERGIHIRSLLARLDQAVDRRIQRVGLSATLNQMQLVQQYLRPEDPDQVEILESKADSMLLKVSLKGYQDQPITDQQHPKDLKVSPTQQELPTWPDSEQEPDDPDPMSIPKRAIAQHIFDHLRDTSNLVFAGSRSNVEWYADALATISLNQRVPLEFLPHHANLSPGHRRDLEARLKSGKPTTAICTSTLELGIDIGDIAHIAQVGPPHSVASLRQRLGRSGRRPGQPAILWFYTLEKADEKDTHPIDRLRLDLVRSVAMLKLLSLRWCEPPSGQALHLSTLVHQVLSIIAERAGETPANIYRSLCANGPFSQVTQETFKQVLIQLGQPNVNLIEQHPQGELLLGRQGEFLTNHHTFYAAFQATEDFRVTCNSAHIGFLPLEQTMSKDQKVILSGKRWRITEIDQKQKLIQVQPSPSGKITHYRSAPGTVHDRIIQEMKNVLAENTLPDYLDETAQDLLKSARNQYQNLHLEQYPITKIDNGNFLVATWTGTIKNNTLALLLKAWNYETSDHAGILEVSTNQTDDTVEDALQEISQMDQPEIENILSQNDPLEREKYHPYLSPDLLFKDALTSYLDPAAMPALASKLLQTKELS